MSTPTAAQQSSSPSTLTRLVAGHPVATFLIMAYTVSIAIAVVRLRTNGDIDQSPSSQYLIGFLEHLFSVALPAFLVVAVLHGKDGMRDLARRSLRWRVGARWYLIALLGLPIGSVLCASVIYGVAPLNALVNRWQLLFTLILPSLLIRIVFLNTIEEIGWLGFLQARFQDQYGPWKACLLVEIPFALWHLPGLLGDTGGQISLALMLGSVFAVFQLCGRFVNMWLYNSSNRSVLPAALFHANFNTTINVYADNLIPVPAEPWFFIVSSVLAAAALLIVIFTRGRLSYKPDVSQIAQSRILHEQREDDQRS
jgi:membrane protease YdiL (CAAX protease family)